MIRFTFLLCLKAGLVILIQWPVRNCIFAEPAQQHVRAGTERIYNLDLQSLRVKGATVDVTAPFVAALQG